MNVELNPLELTPGLLDGRKNNSNGQIEGAESPVVNELIESYGIRFTPQDQLNRKWRRRDKEALDQWVKKNNDKVEIRQEGIKRRYTRARELEKEKSFALVDEDTGETEQVTLSTIGAQLEVQDLLRRVEYEQLNVETWAIKSFKSYLSSAEHRFKVFQDQEEGKRVMSRALHRFCNAYQKKVRIQFEPLLNSNKYRKAVFLTLTLDPKLFDSRYHMWVAIKEEQNRFLTLIFKKIGHRLPYIAVAEAHHNGSPHLHFLFLGASRLMDWRELRDLWGLGHIWINRTRGEDSKKIRNPIKYMAKYIFKMTGKSDDENLTTHAFLWLFHVRSYSMSRGLVKPLNEIGRGDQDRWLMEGILFTLAQDDCELAEIELNLNEIVPVLRESGGGHDQ